MEIGGVACDSEVLADVVSLQFSWGTDSDLPQGSRIRSTRLQLRKLGNAQAVRGVKRNWFCCAM